MRCLIRFTAILALLSPLAGCGGKVEPKVEPKATSDLRDIFELYTEHLKMSGKPPTKLADISLKSAEVVHPNGVAGLKGGLYELVFGLKMDAAAELLAYEKAAPTAGGTVLLADGTIKTVTAAEFAQLKK